MFPYEKQNVDRARELRRQMTPWEEKMWYQFLRAYPLRVQRQKPIGPYIVDFYCAKAKLIIELDGSGHYEPEQQQKDLERTEQLEALGLKVLRFSNLDVERNFYGVCTVIDEAAT